MKKVLNVVTNLPNLIQLHRSMDRLIYFDDHFLFKVTSMIDVRTKSVVFSIIRSRVELQE